MSNNKSEVARFREQQALQESSARLGLCGTAVTASHDATTQRMERATIRFFGMISEGKVQEALACMNSDGWCAEEQQEVTCEPK